MSAEDIIESLCSDIESVTSQRILNQLSSAIISNKLYVPQGAVLQSSGSGLIPSNSKLYVNGSNTSDIPDIRHVRDLLEVKLKIDDPYDNPKTIYQENIADEVLLAGHFRFHLPPMIPPQLVILVRCPNTAPEDNKLLLFYHGNVKLLSVFVNFIQTHFDCSINDTTFSNDLIQRCLNWSVMNDTLNSIGMIELWYGKLNTGGKLGSIVIKIYEKHFKIIRELITKDALDDGEFSQILNGYLESQTSIAFDKLTLIKMKSEMFTISVDGKIKFSNFMSQLGHTSKKAKGDDRLSIWWIIRQLCLL